MEVCSAGFTRISVVSSKNMKAGRVLVLWVEVALAPFRPHVLPTSLVGLGHAASSAFMKSHVCFVL